MTLLMRAVAECVRGVDGREPVRDLATRTHDGKSATRVVAKSRAMTPDALRVRPGVWADRAEIVRLIATMGGHDEIGARADALHEYGSLLRDSNARTIVAEHDGHVVGVVVVQARTSLISDRRIAWLGAFAVDATLRRSGIGRAMLGAIDDAARSLGCASVDLQSSDWRADAHAFYRKNGFDEATPAARFSHAVRAPHPDASLETRFLAAAARAASAVNAAIVDLGSAPATGMGADGARTEAADAAAERTAIAVLGELGLTIVSEEIGLVGAPPGPGDAWIALDPLDGSRNFRAGFPPYAIAVGLVRDGVAIAGFVCDLTSGRRWYAGDDGFAYADGTRIAARRGELVGLPSPTLDLDMPRLHDLAHRARISGSTAIDCCRVADGSLGAFVGIDRQVAHTHDIAGPLAIVRAAGGVVFDRDGKTPALIPDPMATYAIVAAADSELAYAYIRSAASDVSDSER